MTEENNSVTVEETSSSAEPDFSTMDESALESFINGETTSPSEEGTEEEATEEVEEPIEETEDSDPEATDEQTKPAAEEELTPEQYQEQIAQLNARLKQQEQFIARRSTEIGKLRKELAAERAAIQKRAEEGELDPRQILKDEKRLEEISQEESAAVQEHAEMVRIHQAQALMAQHFKPGEVMIDDMVEVLRRDGVPEEYVQKFSEDPYRHADGTSLLQIAKRAKVEKSYFKLFNVAKQLAVENEKLRKAKSDVLKKVDEAASKPPASSAARSAPRKAGIDTDFASMSDEALEAFLQNQK